MKLIVPDYYPQFRCIAGACQHSCCIGWEIDIDEHTLEVYRQKEGPMGDRLRSHIDFDCDCPHFITGPDGRCPFLNEENLCDLIIHMGEESLCGICTDHPRFRTEFSDRTEMGLGLCCEEAARLILTNEETVRLIQTEDDSCETEADESDLYLYSLRDNAIAVAQDRSFSVAERMEHLAMVFDISLPTPAPTKWADTYLQLERLDEAWTDRLRTLQQRFTPRSFPQWEIAFEQLLVYFLYRHLPAALWDGDVESKVAFAILSVEMLRWLCSTKENAQFHDLLELARMYSSEIEYSDENLELLFEALSE